ncbi:hypothetical protein [Leptothoe spongobia]|uniref:Uncharacterized protein n=1 Tax=Leptothoe spongobia TAU-MAC 1115 TaxID=1967444 RepID=A0A947GM28_9CYAN|nr:hypothetical protein [Leptothoe spongobia]MBT9317728.1 hypothetical protein [Leptothoe spongobia TAU-MAC 1115]
MVNPEQIGQQNIRPFIPSEDRSDILRRLSVSRQEQVTNSVEQIISAQIEAPPDTLQAGKAGLSEFDFFLADPGKKDGGKDGGKDVKDGKEGGKDTKEKEGKEAKDSTEGKFGGGGADAVFDLPLSKYGNPALINQQQLGQIENLHSARLDRLINKTPII